MRAEVLSIGDELTTGQRLDTNSQWLSQQLTAAGVEVVFHTTVADVLEDLVAACRTAAARVDIVVMTGGLGPTADDLTRLALAQVAGVELVRDPAALAHIQALFANRKREMPPQNAVQADFPAGAEPIPNPHGTAPGIAMQLPLTQPCTVFALPGVPLEMHAMWADSVAPKIAAIQPEPRVIRHRLIKCFGVGESALEAMLPDLIRRDRQPRVGITASDATITLRITAQGKDEPTCLATMEPTVATIYQTLGKLVFGEANDELEHVVLRLLTQQQQSLAVSEWATGGLVRERLAAAAEDTSPAVLGQVVDPAEGAADDLPTDAAPHSPAMAAHLAHTARSTFGTQLGLGIAAFPPAPHTPGAEVCAAMALPTQIRPFRFPCAVHPDTTHYTTNRQQR